MMVSMWQATAVKEQLSRHIEKKTWIADFRCSWRKVEVADQDRAGWS